MDWKAHLTHQSTTLDAFRKAHPDAAKGFTALHHGTLAEGARSRSGRRNSRRSPSYRQAVHRLASAFTCRPRTRQAATRAQVAETVGVAMMMGGGPAFMYGAKALEAWDQLTS